MSEKRKEWLWLRIKYRSGLVTYYIRMCQSFCGLCLLYRCQRKGKSDCGSSNLVFYAQSTIAVYQGEEWLWLRTKYISGLELLVRSAGSNCFADFAYYIDVKEIERVTVAENIHIYTWLAEIGTREEKRKERMKEWLFFLTRPLCLCQIERCWVNVVKGYT